MDHKDHKIEQLEACVSRDVDSEQTKDEGSMRFSMGVWVGQNKMILCMSNFHNEIFKDCFRPSNNGSQFKAI